MSSLVLRSDMRSSQAAVLLGCIHTSPLATIGCSEESRAKRCAIRGRSEGASMTLVPQSRKSQLVMSQEGFVKAPVSTDRYSSIFTPWFAPSNTAVFQGPARDEKAEEDVLLT